MNIEVLVDQIAENCIDAVSSTGQPWDVESVVMYVDILNLEDEVKDRVRALLKRE